jgi:ATP-dependent DNA helicase 2 subunit 1
VGQNVIEWGEELETRYQTWVQEHGHRSEAPRGVKREAGTAAAPAAKKVKVASSSDGLSVEEMREKFEKNIIDKLTVGVLKDWCSGRGLSPIGKKADLVERVQEYFENKY